jgi:hypothetical protein
MNGQPGTANPPLANSDQGRTTMCKLISALAAASLGAAAWIGSIGYWWPNEIDHPICDWVLNGTGWIWTCGV